MKPLRPRTRIARRLRRDATDVERLLWHALRERLVAWKFRRQHPVGRRIVDFACPERKLAIELDGGQHMAQEEADEPRSEELARQGYRVLRFWNNDVLDNLEGVLEAIDRALRNTPPHPTSPRQRGGEEMVGDVHRIPLSARSGERAGPVAQQREGEVFIRGMDKRRPL